MRLHDTAQAWVQRCECRPWTCRELRLAGRQGLDQPPNPTVAVAAPAATDTAAAAAAGHPSRRVRSKVLVIAKVNGKLLALVCVVLADHSTGCCGGEAGTLSERSEGSGLQHRRSFCSHGLRACTRNGAVVLDAVYALGIYVDATAAKKALARPRYVAQDVAAVAKDQQLFDGGPQGGGEAWAA